MAFRRRAADQASLDLRSDDRYSPEQAARMLQFLSTRLQRNDFAHAWKLIEQRIAWHDQPPRRNGGGGHPLPVRP
jgi:hypothetical protein